MNDDNRVLIAGGGPIGYTMALLLARRGIPFVLLEAGNKIFDDPRAGTIHPPTLELYDTLGVTPIMHEQGYVVRNYHYRDRRQGLVANFDLGVLADETPYPYRMMLEQHKLCYILLDLLKGHSGNEILLEHRVESVEEDGGGVAARVVTKDGEKIMRGRYMIGCDGGRSQVRKSMGVDFKGFTYDERFLILSTRFDFEPLGYAFTNYIADPVQWCALFKVPGYDGQGMWRVVFPVTGDASEDELYREEHVQGLIQGFNKKDGDYRVEHRNIYSVHQRVASCYRRGRMLIAGDAAHINNPLGGMGMNFGVHDAFNLADKLSQVWFDGASEDVFDLYDRQRRTVAEEYLQRQTIENKKNMEITDDQQRETFYAEMRAIAADRGKMLAYLRRVAMIEGFARANSIT